LKKLKKPKSYPGYSSKLSWAHDCIFLSLLEKSLIFVLIWDERTHTVHEESEFDSLWEKLEVILYNLVHSS